MREIVCCFQCISFSNDFTDTLLSVWAAILYHFYDVKTNWLAQVFSLVIPLKHLKHSIKWFLDGWLDILSHHQGIRDYNVFISLHFCRLNLKAIPRNYSPVFNYKMFEKGILKIIIIILWRDWSIHQHRLRQYTYMTWYEQYCSRKIRCRGSLQRSREIRVFHPAFLCSLNAI